MNNKLSKTLLFGPSGFFGPIILEKYPEIICAGRTRPPKYIKNKFYKIKNINDYKKLDKIKFDRVIFLIGNSNHHILNKSNLNTALSYNFFPLQNMVEYFVKRRVKKLIIFSGALIYGKKYIKLPVSEKQRVDGFQNNYLFSKYLSEELSKFYQSKISIINIRLSNIYGPTLLIRPDLVQTLMKDILSNKKEISVWSKKPKRDFIFAYDAADAIIKLLFSKYSGNINLGSGKMHSVGKLCEYLTKISGRKIIDLKKKKLDGQSKFVFNINLAKKHAKWKPKFSLFQGLKKTFEKNKKLHENF